MSMTRAIRGAVASVLTAAVLAVVAVAVWPASEADKARQDGERLGQAVGDLAGAQSRAEVEAELDYAVDDLSGQAGDLRARGPEVHRAFWEGFEEGLPAE